MYFNLSATKGCAMSVEFNYAKQLLEHHVTPTFVLDREGRVTVWNRACAAMTGLKAEDVLGTSDHWRGFYQEPRECLADLILQDRIEAVEELYSAVSDIQVSPGAIAAETWCVLPNSDRRIYIASEALAIRGEDGQLIGVLQTLRDISAMKEVESKYRGLAGLDGLTGIANRRKFDDRIRSEWRRAVRSRAPLSLLLVDIDHFKQFNDSLGHLRGDQCLKTVAGALAGEARREGDFPARYGGEEFAIILPATNKVGAGQIAEKVRASIAELKIPHPHSSVGHSLTVSIGAATIIPASGNQVEEFVGWADVALYRAKDLGRNRVCSVDSGLSCSLVSDRPAPDEENVHRILKP
jgi:diguanylate cyclase (GGDEF)-like protein/PAS domain S-box-containing protein